MPRKPAPPQDGPARIDKRGPTTFVRAKNESPQDRAQLVALQFDVAVRATPWHRIGSHLPVQSFCAKVVWRAQVQPGQMTWTVRSMADHRKLDTDLSLTLGPGALKRGLSQTLTDYWLLQMQLTNVDIDGHPTDGFIVLVWPLGLPPQIGEEIKVSILTLSPLKLRENVWQFLPAPDQDETAQYKTNLPIGIVLDDHSIEPFLLEARPDRASVPPEPDTLALAPLAPEVIDANLFRSGPWQWAGRLFQWLGGLFSPLRSRRRPM